MPRNDNTFIFKEIIPPAQNVHQTVTRGGCIGSFSTSNPTVSLFTYLSS